MESVKPNDKDKMNMFQTKELGKKTLRKSANETEIICLINSSK